MRLEKGPLLAGNSPREGKYIHAKSLHFLVFFVSSICSLKLFSLLLLFNFLKDFRLTLAKNWKSFGVTNKLELELEFWIDCVRANGLGWHWQHLKICARTHLSVWPGCVWNVGKSYRLSNSRPVMANAKRSRPSGLCKVHIITSRSLAHAWPHATLLPLVTQCGS